MLQINRKSSCKTYFFSCALKNLAVSLLPLTKQHNLFYTLKKLIPINAVLCEKCRDFFIIYHSSSGIFQIDFMFNIFNPGSSGLIVSVHNKSSGLIPGLIRFSIFNAFAGVNTKALIISIILNSLM